MSHSTMVLDMATGSDEYEPVSGGPQRATGSWTRWAQRAAIACAVTCTAGGAAMAVATILVPKGAHGQVPQVSSEVVLAKESIQLQEEFAECQVFWRLPAASMVGEGWGSRGLYAAAFYQRFHLWADECNFYVAENVATEWASWGLQVPFEIMPTDEFAQVELDPSLQVVDESFMVGLRGPWRGEPIDAMWSGDAATTNLAYSDWAGCWSSTYDVVVNTMFKGLMAQPKAVYGDYIGLHVRHGDKSVESTLLSFQQTMDAATEFSTLRSAFVATDDADVVSSQTQSYQDLGYEITWTDYLRQAGGEAASCEGAYCHHDSKDDAVKAVLADTMALAHASVLVGSFSSNFFRLAWLLNYLRRSEWEREEDWCRDVLTGLSCGGDRHAFVVDFVDQVRSGNLVPASLLPDPSTNSLRDCSSPSATRRLAAKTPTA